MAGHLTRRGVSVKLYLDTIIASTADADIAALHEEVLLAMDAVLHSCGDVDVAVLDLDILLAVDAVLAVAYDIEGTLALELGVTLDVQGTITVFVGTISQRAGLIFLDADINTLAILDVDGSTAGVGQADTVELDSTFVRAFQIELAVRRSAGEIVDNLSVFVVGSLVHTLETGILHYDDMR